MLTITLTARETHMLTLALFAASRDVDWMTPDNKKYLETMREQIVDAWVEQNPEHSSEPWGNAL